MTEEIRNILIACASAYHCADFICDDPVQFPHRFSLKQDIEISGLLTAIMSFGNRKQIVKKAGELHRLMGESPYRYVLSVDGRAISLRRREQFLPHAFLCSLSWLFSAPV